MALFRGEQEKILEELQKRRKALEEKERSLEWKRKQAMGSDYEPKKYDNKIFQNPDVHEIDSIIKKTQEEGRRIIEEERDVIKAEHMRNIAEKAKYDLERKKNEDEWRRIRRKMITGDIPVGSEKIFENPDIFDISGKIKHLETERKRHEEGRDSYLREKEKKTAQGMISGAAINLDEAEKLVKAVESGNVSGEYLSHYVQGARDNLNSAISVFERYGNSGGIEKCNKLSHRLSTLDEKLMIKNSEKAYAGEKTIRQKYQGLKPQDKLLAEAAAKGKKQLEAEAKKRTKEIKKSEGAWLKTQESRFNINEKKELAKKLRGKIIEGEITIQSLKKSIEKGDNVTKKGEKGLGDELIGIEEEITRNKGELHGLQSEIDDYNKLLLNAEDEHKREDYMTLKQILEGDAAKIAADLGPDYNLDTSSRQQLSDALKAFAGEEAAFMIKNNYNTIYTGALKNTAIGLNSFYDWWGTSKLMDLIFSPITAGFIIIPCLAFIVNMNVSSDILVNASYIIVFVAILAITVGLTIGKEHYR